MGLQCDTIKDLILAHIQDADVRVDSPDNHHFFGLVVSPSFEGQTLLVRQRRVYQALQAVIASGELHAISFKTKTPTELQAG